MFEKRLGGVEINEGDAEGEGEESNDGVGEGGELTTEDGDGGTADGAFEEDGDGACDREGVAALGEAAIALVVGLFEKNNFEFMLLLLLLVSPPANITRGCVAAARPLLEHNVPKAKYINLKPENGLGFQGGNVEACLPKGFRRSSAPSRYINYQPLGSISSACNSSAKVNGP
ncbi:hypothetical protein SESBI_27521 [Sesbania bispinosa]|nr:hypothetical protein SESBI_27521 [Sesbania bispinosa]